LNPGDPTLQQTFSVDDRLTLTIQGGCPDGCDGLDLAVSTGGDGEQVRNQSTEGGGAPSAISVGGVSVTPQPFNGQWFQVDIENIVENGGGGQG
jgi:hypothetical protein